MTDAAGGRACSRRHALALAAVVVAAFAVYALLARGVDAPRAFSDELLYMEVGASIADGEGPSIRGEEYQHARLYAYVLGALLWIVPDREDAYEAAKLLNALLVALVAVPVYLLAQRLLTPWSSVAAAGLAVAIPSAMYVSLVMTESIGYLAFASALLAIVLALERPSTFRQVAALVAILVAAAARTEFIALFGAYVLGLGLVALMVRGRRVPPLRMVWTLLPTVVATLAGVIVFVVIPIVQRAPPSSLGGYSTLWRRYDVTDLTHWLVYHLANLELYVAVVPVAVAPIVLVILYRKARAGSERHAAFLALFATVNAALLLLTAAFNSTIYAGDRLHDRPLFYIVPLWLVLLFVWLADGAPRPLAAAALGAGIALVLPLLIPFPKFTRSEAASQLNGVGTTLWVEVDQWMSGYGIDGLIVLVGFTLLLVLAALLVSARYRYVLAAAVLVVFVLMGGFVWDGARHEAKSWASVFPSDDPSWLDDRGLPTGSVTLVTAIRRCSPEEATRAPYLTEFFNDAVGDVVHLGQNPDYLPWEDARVTRSGRIEIAGEPLRAGYVVAEGGLRLAGRRVAAASTAPLVLWRVTNRVRVLARPDVPGICP